VALRSINKLGVKPELLTSIALVLASGGLFVISNALIRNSVDELHSTVVFFFRNLLSIPLLVPWLLKSGRESWKTDRRLLHLLRISMFCIAMVSWYACLGVAPFAQAEALQFSAPLFAIMGGAIFLGERLTRTRILASVLGVIGVVTIIRPGYIPLSTGTMLALFSAMFMAATRLLTRSLVMFDSPGKLVLFLTVGTIPISLLMAIPFWSWPQLDQYALLALIAGLTTLAQYTVARAYQAGELGLLEPLNFVRIVWASVVGIVFFSEKIDWFIIVGTLITISSVSFVVRASTEKNAHRYDLPK